MPVRKILGLLIFWMFLISSGTFGEDKNMILFNGNSLETFNRLTLLSTGGVIAGESLLLLIGMNIPSASDWVSIKNISFSISDILIGSYMIYAALYQSDLQNSWPFFLLTAIPLITQGYRDYEYLSRTPNAFCANTPLFVMNNVRLFGTALTMGLSVSIRF